MRDAVVAAAGAIEARAIAFHTKVFA